MSRMAKMTGVAALTGLMMAVAIVAATRPDAPAAAPRLAAPVEDGRDRLDRELNRCATLTMPDAGCEAAWAENRRRFFREEKPAPQTERDDASPSSTEGAAP